MGEYRDDYYRKDIIMNDINKSGGGIVFLTF